MSEELLALIDGKVFGVWFLIGAALVFWMQAGFAMCEAGFTRAKNTGNIIMKNLMDFCIGTVVFIVIGFSLLLGEDMMGIIGQPGFDMFSNYANFDYSNFVFNLVFCATTATIVSGSMAERTKFLSYCVYSAVISALIYPIEAHWTWGGGWLSQIGFHDFAGSNCIHMVGGISALIGAAILGPRIGKFERDKNGKVIKVNAFPGHNLVAAALGVFILWLGWYGFNGAACTSVEQLGSVFVTTTIAPALATVTCMIYTWVKYGKPDISMCLNASLAGLVAITAPCDVTDVFGSIVIGIVAGFLVCFGVWLLDYKLHIDDPVGAVAVHCLNGIWGTLAVGIFATNTAPGYSIADSSGNEMLGLLYGGGFKLLGIQFIGVASTALWTALAISATFLLIKKIMGLRVSEEEEILGLDSTEHGLASAYSGFSIMDVSNTLNMTVNENTDLGIGDYEAASEVQRKAAVPVVSAPVYTNSNIHKVVIIAKLSRYDKLRKAMNDLGVTGMTVTQVMGCGIQKGSGEMYRGVEVDATLLPKIKLEVVISKIPVDDVIEAAKKALYTGHIGDGKIFVYSLDNVVKIRTGEEGAAALADVE
ncbi:ammonium transporter, Amt family [Acetitomaculum ruminis DSM 5522]|uniref:Ammonium transporter, Amt family n=1 Tax=Acetitomaculum ruminis DSM 5522 TaxID=1120918 RepID=A0A1I0ZNG3_9FIRM|nr:ammonium transporter [Acetitomaculum ruminis]SFB27037.1 ammonium transporter, Amt family [Acetitomaculum ruminis DSM 5522]